MLAATPGTWQTVATTIPDPNGAQTLLQLSDGTVMVQGEPANAPRTTGTSSLRMPRAATPRGRGAL